MHHFATHTLFLLLLMLLLCPFSLRESNFAPSNTRIRPFDIYRAPGCITDIHSPPIIIISSIAPYPDLTASFLAQCETGRMDTHNGRMAQKARLLKCKCHKGDQCAKERERVAYWTKHIGGWTDVVRCLTDHAEPVARVNVFTCAARGSLAKDVVYLHWWTCWAIYWFVYQHTNI